MDAYDEMFSGGFALNEQIAQQVFDALPDGGLVLAIIDGSGHYWANDADAFSRLNLVETLLGDLQAQVDDGLEPAMTQVGDTMVVVSQLRTEATHCGYVVLGVPGGKGDANQSRFDLIDALLSQIGLVARLTERHRQLSDIQSKCFSAYGTTHAPTN